MCHCFPHTNTSTPVGLPVWVQVMFIHHLRGSINGGVLFSSSLLSPLSKPPHLPLTVVGWGYYGLCCEGQPIKKDHGDVYMPHLLLEPLLFVILFFLTFPELTSQKQQCLNAYVIVNQNQILALDSQAHPTKLGCKPLVLRPGLSTIENKDGRRSTAASYVVKPWFKCPTPV